MPDLRLESGHWNTARMLPQSEFHSTGLDAIVHFCGGAVKVDIVNVLWSNAGFFESQSDGAGGLFRRVAHADPMERLAGGSVPGDFGVDAGAPRASMDVVLENEHPGTFGDHEAIAVGGKRARGAFRSTVPRLGERAQQGVTLDNAGSDWRIHAADQEHGLHSGLNVLIGVTEGIGG